MRAVNGRHNAASVIAQGQDGATVGWLPRHAATIARCGRKVRDATSPPDTLAAQRA